MFGRLCVRSHPPLLHLSRLGSPVIRPLPSRISNINTALYATKPNKKPSRGGSSKRPAEALEAEEKLSGEMIKIAKTMKPAPFKVQRSPEEQEYAFKVGALFNKLMQRENNKLQGCLQRAIRCKQAAVAALPLEELIKEASIIEHLPIPPRYGGAKRLLTETPPIPGFADLYEEEDRPSSGASADEDY